MDRRKFITLASGGIVALAGCADFGPGESPVRGSENASQLDDRAESEDDGPSRLGIRDVRFDGREVVVKVSNSLEVADHVELQSETGQGATFQVADNEARGVVFDPEEIGRPDIRPIGPGEVTAVLYDGEDKAVDEMSFEYDPALSLNVRSAAGSVYRETDDPKASALFTFSNSGTGPTCLASFEVRSGENTVPLTESDDRGNSQTTFLRTGEVEGLDSERFDPVGIDSEEDLILSQGAPVPFGGDGIFAHIGPRPEPTDTFEQVFEVVARTELNREYVFEVTVQFSGGITESSIETTFDTPTYRFEDFEADAELVQPPESE